MPAINLPPSRLAWLGRRGACRSSATTNLSSPRVSPVTWMDVCPHAAADENIVYGGVQEDARVRPADGRLCSSLARGEEEQAFGRARRHARLPSPLHPAPRTDLALTGDFKVSPSHEPSVAAVRHALAVTPSTFRSRFSLLLRSFFLRPLSADLCAITSRLQSSHNLARLHPLAAKRQLLLPTQHRRFVRDIRLNTLSNHLPPLPSCRCDGTRRPPCVCGGPRHCYSCSRHPWSPPPPSTACISEMPANRYRQETHLPN